jgi:hypothetical protein
MLQLQTLVAKLVDLFFLAFDLRLFLKIKSFFPIAKSDWLLKKKITFEATYS